jgi:hypothetical protein
LPLHVSNVFFKQQFSFGDKFLPLSATQPIFSQPTYQSLHTIIIIGTKYLFGNQIISATKNKQLVTNTSLCCLVVYSFG